MKVLYGYIFALLVGTAISQNLLSLLQGLHGQPRILQLRRNDVPVVDRTYIQQNLGIHDADHVNIVPPARSVRTHASATASSSVGLSSLSLTDLLSRAGLLTSLQPSISNLALRRGARIARPRTTAFILDQRLPTSVRSAVQASMPAVSALPAVSAPIPAGLQVAGIPAHGTTMLFDRPDPNTPDTPDLVYAPRSMMGDMQQVEALRNRAEADGVVFV